MARLLLGVSGGIAAYKACELVRLLVRAGHDVIPVPTRGAERFVSAETLFALARQERSADPYPHLREVDLLVIAPLTAHTMARLAHGFADDLVTTLCLATTAPITARIEVIRSPAKMNGSALGTCSRTNVCQALAPSARKSRRSFSPTERKPMMTFTSSGKKQMSCLGGFRAGVHVLEDEEIEFPDDAVKIALVNPGMRWIRSNDPESFNGALIDAVEDQVEADILVQPIFRSRIYFRV